MLSVTDLSSYIYCSRKLYLQRVLGLYEPIKEATFNGSFTHELHDLASKSDEEIVKSIQNRFNLEEIKGIYLVKYKELLRHLIIKNKDML